jgi:xanthine dehydrogenase YagR molybdenum-binding subunit
LEQAQTRAASQRQGNYFIGYGVSCGTYPARQRDTSAIIKLTRNGGDVRASVELAASDLGTGNAHDSRAGRRRRFGFAAVENRRAHRRFEFAARPWFGRLGRRGEFRQCRGRCCVKNTDELIAKSGKQFYARPTAAEMMQSEKLKRVSNQS